MTMFEMIDALEPIIPERGMNRTKALRRHIWAKDNPEAWRAIVKKQNDKRKGDNHERVGAGDR